MDCSPPGSSVYGILQASKNTGVGRHSLLQGIFSHPGMEPGSPALQADSSPSEPLKNEILPFATTWVDLQGMILSEINQTKTDII